MRRRVPLISLVLAAALLAGQMLAAAHDGDHGLQPGAAHGCVVCVYAHGAGHGALPALPLLSPGATVPAPELPLVAAAVAVTVRLHPIRGPPALPL
ncbi:MAG: hypothetical protein ACRETF_07830 [Nevskiaceae bacterium]